jgi:hypothetical protein
MSQIQKLIKRLLSHPKDFTWDELKKLLTYLGYEEIRTGKTGGSRRKFIGKDKHIINLHKPHPGLILKSYQVNQIIETLNEKKLLKDE